MAQQVEQKVQLGCGTLILIALIVLLFGRGDRTDLGPVLQRLDAIERKIDQLERQVQDLKAKP